MGSYRYFGAKGIAEELPFLDVNWLNRNGYLQGGEYTISWTCNGNPSGDIKIRTEEDGCFILEYKYRQNEGEWEDVTETIILTRTLCNYGGKRPWFICPECGRKVGKLYAGGKYFFCRICCNLAYYSQREPIYERLMDKAHNIQKKLGGKPGALYSFPEKPKGMHWKTYNQLNQKYKFYRSASLMSIGERLGIEPPMEK